MNQTEAENHPFSLYSVHDLGFSWEEAEVVVKGYCRDHNISDEDCEKLLSIRSRKIEEPFIRLYDDGIEPFKFTNKDGIPVNIYQLMEECGYKGEEAEIVVNQYCDHMKYDKLKKEKVFFEWKCYQTTPEEIMNDFLRATHPRSHQ